MAWTFKKDLQFNNLVEPTYPYLCFFPKFLKNICKRSGAGVGGGFTHNTNRMEETTNLKL